jgi:hypothetical protein
MVNYMLNLSTNNRRLCPFLQEPFDDCYCSKMSSQDIERAVYLCSNNYRMCDIYKNGNGHDDKDNGNGHD